MHAASDTAGSDYDRKWTAGCLTTNTCDFEMGPLVGNGMVVGWQIASHKQPVTVSPAVPTADLTPSTQAPQDRAHTCDAGRENAAQACGFQRLFLQCVTMKSALSRAGQCSEGMRSPAHNQESLTNRWESYGEKKEGKAKQTP